MVRCAAAIVLSLALLFTVSGITVQADILGGLSVDEKGLITDSPSHDDILENHGEWAKGMAHIKTSPFPALAYVTPWNSKGYDIAKWFSGKFSYISPVWFTVRPQGKDGWTIEGEYKCVYCNSLVSFPPYCTCRWSRCG